MNVDYNIYQVAERNRPMENPSEIETLYQDILINVTSFFGEPEAFEVLKRSVFPHIVEKAAGDVPVRIWVPDCSTGEEAYSVALALAEYMDENRISRNFKIEQIRLINKANIIMMSFPLLQKNMENSVPCYAADVEIHLNNRTQKDGIFTFQLPKYSGHLMKVRKILDTTLDHPQFLF
jgi:CheR methyltransferase, SAM binding domain